MDNSINIDDTSEQYKQISIDNPLHPTALVGLPSDALEDRSAIASMGLSNTSGITQDQFRDAISSGQEGAIRQQAAAKVNETKINMAKQMVDTLGPRLSDSALKELIKAQDPNSVFEDHYAKAYMDFLNWPKTEEKQDNWVWTVADTHPEAWDYAKQQGSKYLGRFAYLQDKAQDVLGHTTWWDTVSSVSKDLATLGAYGELKMRTGAAGTGTISGGLGLGTNLDEQAKNLWDEPDDEKFKAEVNRVVTNLPNDYAVSWLKAMVNQTHAERYMGNAFTALNAAGIAQLGAPIAKTAVQRAFVEANAQVAYRRITKAAADMVTPKPAEIAPKVAAPAMAGNTTESGIQKVIIDNLNEINQRNNPIKTLTDRMLNIYDTLNTSVSGNPGNLGREYANRLSDLINSNKENFVNTVMNDLLARGDRTPTVELEQNVRKIHEGLKDMFKGPDNMVLDISHSIYIPGLNVRMYNVAIGSHDAAMFGSIDEAKAVARRQGWVIKGDYNVTPEDMVGVNRKEAAIRGLRTQASRAETPEGAALANSKADALQKELDALPRHDTGITIEGQFRPGQAYTAPIGPTRPIQDATQPLRGTSVPPRKPTGALKSTEPRIPTSIEKSSVEPSNVSGVEEPISNFRAIAGKYTSSSSPEMQAIGKRLEEMANRLEGKRKASPEASNTTSFTTEKGSTYQVHSDGTTTRNKAKGIHEGDFGPKPRSEKTIYVDSDKATYLSGAGLNNEDGKGFHVILRNGKASLISWNTKVKGWGVTKEGFEVPYSETPDVGKAPLELWNKNTHQNLGEVYSKQHAGHKIIAEDTGAPGRKPRFQQVAERDKTGDQDISNAIANILGISSKPQPSGKVRQSGFDKRGRDFAGIGDEEHVLQYNTRRKMEREWNAMSPEEQRIYSETGTLPADIAERAKARSPSEDMNDPIPEFNEHVDQLKKEGKDTPANLKEAMEKFWGFPSDVFTQQGNGYYILHTVFLPEEANFVRDGLVNSPIGGLPVSELRRKLKLGEVSTGIPDDWAGGWVNYVLGRIRSPAERLSTAENLNRIIATHGPSVLLGMLEDGSKPIAQMPKRYWNDFNRMVRFLQRDWNEATGTPGRWFNSPAEVDDWYRRNIRRAPDPTEVAAYFAYRTLMIDDLNMRNLAVMQRKLIMGAKQYAVTYMNAEGKKITTPFFEGVAVDKIPENARIMDIKADGSKSSWKLSWRIKDKEVIEQDVAEGRAKIIHIFNPKERPLSDVDPRTADYIITYVNQEKPLGFNHVNAMDGGHMIPKWGWFLKQANIDSHYFEPKEDPTDIIEGEGIAATKRYLSTPSKTQFRDPYHVYNGDSTLFSFKSKAEAEAVIPHLERVRQLLIKHLQETGNDARALQRWENEGGTVGKEWYQQAAEEAAHTGVPFEKLTKWWLGPNAPYNIHEPIQAVPMGGNIMGLNNDLKMRYVGSDGKPNIIDATKDGSLLGKAMIGFTQERDMEGLYTLRRTGTESNPAFAYEPAPLIDPITAMERGYGGVVKTMFTYDMKKFSMEHWLEQAKRWLASPETIRTNPNQHFYSPVYLDSTPDVIKANLEANRRMAMDFVGVGDQVSNSISRIGQAISDAIYRNSAGKRQIAALYDLPKETDYFRWIRNVAFYASQISLKTYFTQASTISNIYAIAGPKNASKATAAMMMYGWWKMASGKPEVLAGLDNALARHFGWQPGKFTEAIDLMEGAGFAHVGSEHSMREGISSAGLQWAENSTPIGIGWRTTTQFGRTLLDYGSLPFNLGAGTTRTSAFFTAYLETLEKAPAGVIDRNLRDAMLGRASLLDANMTTAFNTRLNKGIMSIPMQFNNYDKNMVELMWGKQLTPREKMALFASSSVMFGMRGGFYAAVGLPIANYVLGKTETALGYVPGENPLSDMVVNGFPSWMFHFLSGGPFIDFSNWGNRGIQPLEDFVNSDKTVADVALGAVGGVFGQAWQNTWGMRRAVQDMMKPGGFRMTSDDIFQAAKTLSGVNDINKAWLAFETGKLYTRNDTYVTDISKTMAAIQAITGLSPIAAKDVWIKQKQLSAQADDIKNVERQIAQEIMRGAIDGGNGDESNHQLHIRNARALLEYIPREKWEQAMKEAFLGVSKSMEDRVNFKLYKNDLDMLTRAIRSK